MTSMFVLNSCEKIGLKPDTEDLVKLCLKANYLHIWPYTYGRICVNARVDQ